MSWFARLWHALVDAVLRTSAHAAETAVQQVDVFSQLEADTLNLIQSVKDLKKFSFDPKWKTRVISAPRAIEGMQELFDLVLHGFRDKFSELHVALLSIKNALHHSGVGRFAETEPSGRLAKVVNWFGDLYTALQAFERAYHDVTDIAMMLDDVKRRIETLDDLFLPQGSSKTTVEIKYRKRNA